MKGTRLVVFMWLLAVVVITWDWVKRAGQAPPASAFVGTGIVYPIAAAITALPFASAGVLGGTFAVGWTLNLLYMAAGAPGEGPKGQQDSAPQGGGTDNVVQMKGRGHKGRPHMDPGAGLGGVSG